MPNRSDNFNRANNALTMGTPSDSGSPWIATYPDATCTWGIASNQAYYTGASGTSITLLESFLSDANISVKVASPFVAGTNRGIAFRATDVNNHFRFTVNATAMGVSRYTAGSFVSIGSFTGAQASGDIYRILCSGTSISIYQNEVLRIGPLINSNYVNVTKHGLVVSETSHVNRWDDFSITSIGEIPPPNSGVFTGPSTGNVGGESNPFTITLNALSIGTTTINLSSSGPGDFFRATPGGGSVTSINVPDVQTVGNFYIVPATTGVRTITPTSSGITFVPSSLNYTSAAIPTNSTGLFIMF